MAAKTPKRNPKKGKSKVSLPTEDETDWSQNTPKSRPGTTRRLKSRPGTAKSRPGTAKSRPGTAKSKKKVTIDSSSSEHNRFPSNTPKVSISLSKRSHSSQASNSSILSTPTGRSGLTYKEAQESLYPPPIGDKHKVMGKKKIPTIQAINHIQSAVQRGFKHNRRIEKSKNYEGGLTEEQTREVSEADQVRLQMMNNYFGEKIDEYKAMIEKCKEDARKKRERNKNEGVRKINALGPFMMSKKFYNMMEADISQVYIAYRRLSSTSSAKKMGSYDHIMYDDAIKDGLVDYKTKFVHLVCKPYQCWMNLFNIDETAAKELSEVGLLVLEHFNKVGRYKQAFPKWLIDLRGWEHSIAYQYLSKAVYVFEVIEHIKNGNYWARYHQYLREENDDVYLAKWTDGTNFFPHKSTALYWYFHESDVDHWMTLDEYTNKKKMKGTKSKKDIFVDGDGLNMSSDDSVDNRGSGDEMVRTNKKKHKSRKSIEDATVAEKATQALSDENEESKVDAIAEEVVDNSLEYLDNIVVSDSEEEKEVYSSSASDDSIPVNKDIYRCPLELETDNGSAFDGWTAYHQSFVKFINRDLLQVTECEREMARNPSEDHWRRRHLYLGNRFDLPICQYRLISKKLNLEHEVRENLRMIAILRKNDINNAGNACELTVKKYMPEWVKLKALTHFNKLLPQIRKQQSEYTPQKKGLLETLKQEIQIREAFNAQIRQDISNKKDNLQSNLYKLKSLNDRQTALINYIVTAKHRVANAKLKVAYAKAQVEILENDVQDLREMTPREKEFAKRNKHYYEAVSVNKLCKQYKSLKRNNYDPNSRYLSGYRKTVKDLLKKVVLYNLWHWTLKQRYATHKKFEVFQTAYEICNPCKSWDYLINDTVIQELLMSNESVDYHGLRNYDPQKMRREQFMFKLKEEKDQRERLPDEEEEKDKGSAGGDSDEKKEVLEEKASDMPEILKDEYKFEREFYIKKRQTDKYAALNMGNTGESKLIFERKLAAVMEVMTKFMISDDILRRKSSRRKESISSQGWAKRRRISESSVSAMFEDETGHGGAPDHEETLFNALAGAQRKESHDWDESDYDEDESDWTDESDYEDDDDEYTEEDTEFSNQSESFDSQEEYSDGDQYEETQSHSDLHTHSMQNFKPTVYSDSGSNSDIRTDSDSGDDGMRNSNNNIRTHRREQTTDDADNGYEHSGPTPDNIDLKNAMGQSGYLSMGYDRTREMEELADFDEFTDESGSESYSSEYSEEDYDEEEMSGMQNRFGGGGGYGQASFSMAGGGHLGGNDDEDEEEEDEDGGGAGMRRGQQQSFSMAGGHNNNNAFGVVSPNDDYDDEDDSYDTGTGDEED